ncbi:hypothetical protein N7532_010667 [Penicillium argentinense]|uniref:Uncharacterized protein n=1 Tax=Penicillium argentinense TaxID=1131581 RepID=A0A9W9EQ48_9EURO|nr:uncharacterized protein N7532_010667 [Penicillium argentinense]KAJ5085896.1 hypothetical protein N7532_010667 [Penicillium argentinense]
MCALLTSLLALPALGLIAIPLFVSAWITVVVALFTLCVRLSVVYVELVYEFVVNFFTLPAVTSSLLTFAPSEPPTPAPGSRRNSTHGLIHPRKSHDSLSSWSIIDALDNPSKRSKKTYARSMVEAHHLPTGPLFGMPVSGDEWRDFEGVGGWRSYADRSRSKGGPKSLRERPITSLSSSSTPSATGEVDPDDIDEDERAWLSLNDRLELPSQVLTWAAGSNVTSPTHLDSLSPRGSISHALIPAMSPRLSHSQHQSGERHHRRSHTTSSLTTADQRSTHGLSISFSNRPDHTCTARASGHAVSPSASRLAPFMTPQLYPTLRASRTMPVTTATNGLSTSTDGGYFALPRPGSYVPSLETRESPSLSGYTTPGTMGSEDRDVVTPQLTRMMAHYPISVRHRRRSISGPHAKASSIGERIA